MWTTKVEKIFCLGVLGEVNTTSYNSQERYRLMLYQMLLLHFLVRGK